MSLFKLILCFLIILYFCSAEQFTDIESGHFLNVNFMFNEGFCYKKEYLLSNTYHYSWEVRDIWGNVIFDCRVIGPSNNECIVIKEKVKIYSLVNKIEVLGVVVANGLQVGLDKDNKIITRDNHNLFNPTRIATSNSQCWQHRYPIIKLKCDVDPKQNITYSKEITDIIDFGDSLNKTYEFIKEESYTISDSNVLTISHAFSVEDSLMIGSAKAINVSNTIKAVYQYNKNSSHNFTIGETVTKKERLTTSIIMNCIKTMQEKHKDSHCYVFKVVKKVHEILDLSQCRYQDTLAEFKNLKPKGVLNSYNIREVYITSKKNKIDDLISLI